MVKDRTRLYDNGMDILAGSFVDFLDFENVPFNGKQMSALTSILIH